MGPLQEESALWILQVVCHAPATCNSFVISRRVEDEAAFVGWVNSAGGAIRHIAVFTAKGARAFSKFL